VRTPTLLIVGGDDEELVTLNKEAFAYMRWRRDLRVIPGANHLFTQPGSLQQVARLSIGWFCEHMEAFKHHEHWG
jgi:hypothetical protein